MIQVPDRKKLYDFLRASAQEHAVFRQNHAVLAAAKELDAQLRFQLHQLPGKRGLRYVQKRRRLRDVFLPRHGEEVRSVWQED